MTTSTTSTSPNDRVPYAAMIPIAERVVAYVQAHAEGVGRSDIAHALGVPPATVGSALSRAVAEGAVIRLGRGIYAPTADAEQRAADGHGAATGGRVAGAQRHDGIRIKLGRMGRSTGLLLSAPDGFGEAFIPREALPDLRRRLARAQAEIEARP